MRLYTLVFLLSLTIANVSQAQEVEVLTLGTFHFSFPNLDVVKIENGDQIDVLDPKHQTEIKELVARLNQFKPTHVVIERQLNRQEKIDSLYQQYLKGNHELSRDESQQLGFRIAKLNGLDKIHCADSWGHATDEVENVLSGVDSVAHQEFMDFFYTHPDTSIFQNRLPVYQQHGIIEDLVQSNSRANQIKDLGNYLLGVFKYETDDNQYFGVDFTTGWWFNRNLRIFKNIQKINTKPGDRVLVIFGSGHMNILNPLFEASPEYKLIDVNSYLESEL